jgi:hypothetical protein
MYRWLAPLLVLILASCQSASEKPDEQADHPGLGPLVSSVQESRAALQTAADQFQSVGNQLWTMAAGNASSVEAAVMATQQQYDAAVDAAAAVGVASAAVDQAADTVFREWQIEAGVFTDPRLKADSQAKLTAAWQEYQVVSQSLRQAVADMDPVLAELSRAVAFLKANPTASAVASRTRAMGALQSSIHGLVGNLNDAVTSSDIFLSNIK